MREFTVGILFLFFQPSILSEDNVKLKIPRSQRESFVKRHLSSMPATMRRQVTLSNVLHRLLTSEVGVSPEEFVDVRIYEKIDATAFVKAFEPLVKNHEEKRPQLRLVGHILSRVLSVRTPPLKHGQCF